MRITRWDQELPKELDREISTNLALWFLLGCQNVPEAERLSESLLSGDPRPLIDFDIDYKLLSVSDAANLRQAQALFSKREDLELGYDKAAAARKKFRNAEEACRLTNECFRLRASGKFCLNPRVERILFYAQSKIARILGDIPKLSDLRFRFGPGATTQIPRRMASARAKLGTTPACSSELAVLAGAILDEMPAWTDSLLLQSKNDSCSPGPMRLRRIAAGPRRDELATHHEPSSEGEDSLICLDIHSGKIAFVPKSAKEFRSVLIEPSLNTMCQAGIGSYMAERLRSCGIDIRDQTRNQKLARKGSIDDSLATIDLSSASDTVSIELVWDLLGPDWACWLSRFRTGTATLDGVSFRLEKFSSMGNGFTFPLETLIFYAIAWGVCQELDLPTHELSVYGDDVIIPAGAYDCLVDAFTACGFTVNMSKSFSDGPFRESCGADYYQGIDIRPVYQKTVLHGFDLFRLHNAFKRNFESEACAYILGFIDDSIRLFGPDGYGDGHLLGEWVPVRKPRHAALGYGGYIFDTFTHKSRRSAKRYLGDCVLPTYTTYLAEARPVGIEPLPQGDAQYLGLKEENGSDFSVTVPGSKGINRISIYVLTT